jgi:hypothetical protein
MRIGFDIGGVLSKYPEEFRQFLWEYIDKEDPPRIYVITDQHPKDEVLKTLRNNDFGFIHEDDIYCANYEQYGNAAKAKLIAELKLDMFIDDFDGYLQWDSSFGPQPILLKVQPDMFKPYWHETWKAKGGDFGRRKYTPVEKVD